MKIPNMLRSTALVLAGTLLAQVVSIISLPVLSRLYSPAEIGVFQVLTSAMATLLPLISLKYEFAILSERRDRHVALLIVFCIVFGLVASALVPITAMISRSLGWEVGPIWTGWLIVALLMGGGVFQTSWQVAVRDSRHLSMAAAKPLQSLVFNLTAILGGVFGTATATILVFGDILSRFSSSAVALRFSDLSGGNVLSKGRAGVLAKLLCKYRKYPTFSAPSGVVGAFASSLPVFWLAASYADDVAGQFSMVWRTVFMPLSMLILAVNQVVTGRLSAMAREGRHDIGAYVFRISVLVLGIGFLPILSLILWGRPTIIWLLGPEWVLAGDLLLAMIPLLLSLCVGGPIGMALVILLRPDLQLIWDIARLCLLVGLLAAVAALEYEPVHMVAAYSFGMLASSIGFLTLAIWASRRGNRI